MVLGQHRNCQSIRICHILGKVRQYCLIREHLACHAQFFFSYFKELKLIAFQEKSVQEFIQRLENCICSKETESNDVYSLNPPEPQTERNREASISNSPSKMPCPQGKFSSSPFLPFHSLQIPAI